MVPVLIAAAVLVFICSFIIAAECSYAASAASTAATGSISVSDYASLRKSSSVSSKEIDRLRPGTGVVIRREVFKSRTSVKKTDRWYYVSVNGKKGYVRSDLVSGIRYSSITGTVTSDTVCRKGAGTMMSKAGSLKKGETVSVRLIARPVSSTSGSSPKWYRIKLASGSYYVSSADIDTETKVGLEDNSAEDVKAGDETADKKQEDGSSGDRTTVSMSDSEFNKYLKKQGFPKAYRTRLRALHKKHPNWRFVAFDTGIKWSSAVSRIARSAQIESGASMKSSSYISSAEPEDDDTEAMIYENMAGELELGTSEDVSDYYEEFAESYSDPKAAENAWMSGSGLVIIEDAQTAGWVRASSNTTAFFMDPRNFLTEKRIYMFEDLSYDPDYQTKDVVGKILAPTKLPGYGFTAKVFVAAGKKYDVSPVHLASRARQETGGGSIAINGSQDVYNPFNIGAYSTVTQGISYARSMGWNTPQKAVNGGASFISRGYISKGQNTIYFQRFDVTKGLSSVGTHVYMTNIRAPYFEATSTSTAYRSYGISKEALTFVIPVYKGMPAETSL